MMSVVGRYRLIVNAAQAKPSPSIGQTLGPLGINMMSFCKEFNARTSKLHPDVPVQVTLIAYKDRSFKFWLRTPSACWFIRRCSRMPVGATYPGHEIVGNVKLKELYHIAKAKCMDPPLIGKSLYSICTALVGTARSMGLIVSRELTEEYCKRDFLPISELDKIKAHKRQLNKAAKRGQSTGSKK